MAFFLLKNRFSAREKCETAVINSIKLPASNPDEADFFFVSSETSSFSACFIEEKYET